MTPLFNKTFPPALLGSAALIWSASAHAQLGPMPPGHGVGQAQPYSERNVRNGYLGLDANALVPLGNLPPIPYSQVSGGPSLGQNSGQALPAYPQTFSTTPVTFAGKAQYNVLTAVLNAASPAAAEAGIFVSLTSTAGATNSNYKASLIGSVLVQPGGGSGYGANLVCSLAAGFSPAQSAQTVCRGAEIDVNNADADRGGSVYTSANWVGGLLINGGGTNQNNSGVEIARGPGGFHMWETALRIVQPLSDSVGMSATADMYISTNSIEAILVYGSHQYGINLNNGNYSQFQIIGPGFTVGPLGTVGTVALNTPVVTAVTATYPKFVWNATGNSADQKQWQFYADPGGNLVLTSLNDAGNAVAPAMQFTRGTGTMIAGASVTPLLTASGGISTPGITQSLSAFAGTTQPGNPAAGAWIIYSDNATGHLTALKSDGTKTVLAN